MPNRIPAPDGNGHGHPAVPVDAAFAVDYAHRLRFTRDALDPDNPVLAEVLRCGDETGGRLAAFIDDGVARAWPGLEERVAAYLDANVTWLTLAAGEVVAGGEACKNDWSVYRTVARTINDAHVCRQSFVVAIGGGAVLDAVGFAAATAHRGVRLVRLPTTTLAQADSGVGVKNGINAFGKKNFLGTFAVPWAVVNDERFLTTLSDRDWRCGLSEAVKVALLKDPRLLDLLESCAPRLRDRDQAAAAPILRRAAELHLQHIVTTGDPFELGGARPLDFGHWSAHKLEQMTGFRIRHGEAVATGLAIDVVYSAMTGRLPGSDAQRVLAILENLGFRLHDEALNTPELFDGLEEFREHLGGRMSITLLEGIGQPCQVHEIDLDRMSDAVAHLRALASEEIPPRRRGDAQR